MSGVSKSRAFKKSGVKLQCLTEANPRETTFGSKDREFWIIQYMYSKNQDFSVFQLMLSDWHFKPVLRPKGCLRAGQYIFNSSSASLVMRKSTNWNNHESCKTETDLKLQLYPYHLLVSCHKCKASNSNNTVHLYIYIYLAFFYSCSLYS